MRTISRTATLNRPYAHPEVVMAAPVILPTTLVGSCAQPDWLIDRAKLAGRFPPRVGAKELWRVEPEFLAQAQDDATVLAIRAQEDAGLDIITDGEMRRESYSNHFGPDRDRHRLRDEIPPSAGCRRQAASDGGRRAGAPSRPLAAVDIRV
jgi:hypothetical protein